MEVIYFLLIDIKIRAAGRKMTYVKSKSHARLILQLTSIFKLSSSLEETNMEYINIWVFNWRECFIISTRFQISNLSKRLQTQTRGFQGVFTLLHLSQDICWPAFQGRWEELLGMLWLSDHALTASPASYSYFPSTSLVKNHVGLSLEHTFLRQFRAFAALCCNVPAWSCAPCCGVRGEVLFQETPS